MLRDRLSHGADLAQDPGHLRPGESEIEEKLSFNHYAATRAQAQAARLDEDTLESMYRACAQAEYDIKRGALRDQAAVDSLMLKLGRG